MDEQFSTDIRELLGWIDRLRAPLRNRYDSHPEDPEVGWIAQEMLDHLGTFESGLKELFQREWDQPQLAAENRAFYYRTSRAVDVFEKHLIPQILRFDETDRFMTRLIAYWMKEINWPDARQPFVIPDSDMFFVSFPKLTREIAPIRVPRSAADDIRALVFDIHEMTHILLRSNDEVRTILQGDLRRQIGHYFVDSDDPELSRHTEIISIWRDAWLEEMTCDMVATYVTGKAFSDQTLRSTRLMWETIFEDEESHPAWGARLAGSAAVLRAMGHVEQADQVEADMKTYIARTGEMPGTSYEKLYPDALVQSIADRVVQGCEALGIKSFDQVSRTTGVLSLITRAWDNFRLEPITYRIWELGALTRVRSALMGPPGPDAGPQMKPTPRPKPMFPPALPGAKNLAIAA